MDRLNEAARLRATSPRTLALETGRAWPLGAEVRDGGVNFAVFSEHASAIELCLFDDEGRVELARAPLPACSGDVWHGFLPGAGAGLVYGLRAHGPWRPDRGHRFNPRKLLLDPWAREIVGRFDWRDAHAGHDEAHPQHPDLRDNGPAALKARVVDDVSAPCDRPVAVAPADTVLYEMHVRSFTRLMPGVPESERGTFAGLASDAAIAHLRSLGVTSVSLLPVHQKLDERALVERGLVNHWGYNTIGFFCPEPRYAASAARGGRAVRDEFRAMVRRLHAAGIEVLLDVVFNHTPEGDGSGPTIAWRGLDNRSWYRLRADDPSAFENWSGCGNTLDLGHPRVLQFVLDSLRWWVQAMHVDGFRFDLAPVLGRVPDGSFSADAPFFQALSQDPVLQRCKLIAEPWDLGPAGYRLGGFPRGWLEWNDRYRDTARAFWLGGDCTRGEFAQRLCASSDLFQRRRRQPAESVNYIVSHDGFTLADLVSYDLRHNEANGEDNRDGHAHNLSWNCGWEGPTGDPDVLALRGRLQRALLATLAFSQGTPMLAAGDEVGHSAGGNNNPYCQDNETTWIDWGRADTALLDFTRRVFEVRRRLGPLGTRWYTGLPDAHGIADLAWLRRTGEPFSADDWRSRMSRVIGAMRGRATGVPGPVLLLFNAHDRETPFRLPTGRWRLEIDSSEVDGRREWQGRGGDAILLAARSVTLLVAEEDDPGDDSNAPDIADAAPFESTRS
jgi:glycogen operon protein